MYLCMIRCHALSNRTDRSARHSDRVPEREGPQEDGHLSSRSRQRAKCARLASHQFAFSSSLCSSLICMFLHSFRFVSFLDPPRRAAPARPPAHYSRLPIFSFLSGLIKYSNNLSADVWNCRSYFDFSAKSSPRQYCTVYFYCVRVYSNYRIIDYFAIAISYATAMRHCTQFLRALPQHLFSLTFDVFLLAATHKSMSVLCTIFINTVLV